MLSLLLIGGDPPPKLGPLGPYVNADDRPNVVGSAIVAGAWLLALVAFFAGAIIVDQYPCWVGVPNCDWR